VSEGSPSCFYTFYIFLFLHLLQAIFPTAHFTLRRTRTAANENVNKSKEQLAEKQFYFRKNLFHSKRLSILGYQDIQNEH
jgi:hypothetical protein